MIDRDKVVAVLRRRFAGASARDLAEAANALVGLDDEWEEVGLAELPLGPQFSVQCADICYLGEQIQRGVELRLFRKRPSMARAGGL